MTSLQPGTPDPASAYASDAARQAAVAARDAGARGVFVYAVLTTGIYCRPDCPSRRARPAHIRFFADGPAAAAAGFRPCRRCRPDEPAETALLIARAVRLIERAHAKPRVADLAASLGVSPAHFSRLFKAATGVSPAAYAAARRRARAHTAVQDAPSLTTALYDAGFQASSRFYAQAEETFGMTPRTFRHGGRGLTIDYAIVPSTLGPTLVAMTGRGVCMVAMDADEQALLADLRTRFAHAQVRPAGADHEAWIAAVVAAIDTPAQGRDLPLDIQGSAFQQRVWQALRAIPSGETRSYGALAAALGMPRAARAIATACAANPIAVLVPCHRVVGQDGALTGYRWGVARKQALLAREGAVPPAPAGRQRKPGAQG